MMADAMFVKPENGDYRVAVDSPARQLGFKNFAMDRFGVQNAELKTIARTPLLPVIQSSSMTMNKSSRNNQIHNWLGAEIKNIVGDGEVSATGLYDETGVWMVKVPADGFAAQAGLRDRDVIIRYNDHTIDTVQDLLNQFMQSSPKEQADIILFRDQNKKTQRINIGPSIRLDVRSAGILGNAPKPVYDSKKHYLGRWHNTDITLQWKLPELSGGSYNLIIHLACAENSAGATYMVRVSGSMVSGTVVNTGGWETFKLHSLGVIDISSEEALLELKPLKKPGTAVMNIKEIILTKVSDIGT
jgi:hypothetical protein